MKKTALALLLFSLNAFAQPAKLTLDQAITEFTGTSPQLSAQKEQIEIAEDDRWRRFLPNEPQAFFSSDEGQGQKVYGLNMNFEFPGKSLAFRKLDKVSADNEKREMAARRFDLTSTITQAYIDCAQAQAVTKVRQNALKDYDNFFTQVKSRRAVNMAEKISAELEAREASRSLTEAGDDGDVKCRKLRALLPSLPAALPELVFPEDLGKEIVASLGPSSADQTRSLAVIEMANVKSSLARWAQAPELTVSAGRSHFASDDKWANLYSISMRLPIFYPFVDSAETRRTRSQAALDRSDAELKKIQADGEKVEAARTYRRQRNALKELRDRDLPLARSLVDSTFSNYRGGQMNYVEVLLARRRMIDLRLKEIDFRGAMIASRLKCLDTCEE